MDASFWISVGGFLVSLLSVVALFSALRQIPRPYFVRRFVPLDVKSGVPRSVSLELKNLGRGEAIDVVIMSGGKPGADGDRLCDSELLTMTEVLSSPPISLTGGSTTKTGMEFDFEIRWRQAPTLNRTRTKTFVLHVDPSGYNTWEQSRGDRFWMLELNWLRYYLPASRNKRNVEPTIWQ
jgi:hypothetical protein